MPYRFPRIRSLIAALGGAGVALSSACVPSFPPCGSSHDTEGPGPFPDFTRLDRSEPCKLRKKHREAEAAAQLGVERRRLQREAAGAAGVHDLEPDEVRAWTIRRGTHARRAAGKIHSDLERGFIRAEVTPYSVFMEHGSEAAVKAAGKLQVEGQDYEVQDGDIMHVRFNV